MRWHGTGFFFSSRRRHTRLQGDWSSDVCSSDLTWPGQDAIGKRLKFGSPDDPQPWRTVIGRASCRKSVDLGGRRIIKKKKKKKTTTSKKKKIKKQMIKSMKIRQQ